LHVFFYWGRVREGGGQRGERRAEGGVGEGRRMAEGGKAERGEREVERADVRWREGRGGGEPYTFY
jgi:hypothetical protein